MGCFPFDRQPPPRLPRSYGAQAVAIQAGGVCDELFNGLLESPHSGTQLDFWISRVCRDMGIPFLIHRPSLVQHGGAISSLAAACENAAWRRAASVWVGTAAGPSEPGRPAHARFAG